MGGRRERGVCEGLHADNSSAAPRSMRTWQHMQHISDATPANPVEGRLSFLEERWLQCMLRAYILLLVHISVRQGRGLQFSLKIESCKCYFDVMGSLLDFPRRSCRDMPYGACMFC